MQINKGVHTKLVLNICCTLGVLSLKAKGHLVVKEQYLILAACKGMARGDAPGELKLKLSKMVTPMPL